jgi:DNA uptake protein ComE-like DNA-binding protein
MKKLAGFVLVAFAIAGVPSSLLGMQAAQTPAAPAAKAAEDKPLVNLNVATAAELEKLPNMSANLVKATVGKRPFPSIVEFNTLALAVGATQEQLGALYEVAFIPVKLNTATREQILLIPRAGNRMVREFAEYRPWKTKAQFEKEISKYVGDKETARLWKYVVID